MLKKGFIYFVLFIFLAGINFFLTVKAFAVFDKQAQIEKILSDINEDKNSQFYSSNAPINNKGSNTEVSLADGRAANLKAFFRKYNSPLYNWADKIVEVSDFYQFDYRLLPAIAMQESNLCRVIPDDSHNCWGWGIYGTTVTKFDSYDEAIETVAKGIKKEYIDKGLVTASAIMKKYTPPSQGSWAHGVNTFLRALE
ncbi:hypothetical protein HZA76_01695 [Candidatus Roizmanbacteria bacterium]|nr:hypothetical protein [Candidatus Roizmanbacteria bacterium]